LEVKTLMNEYFIMHTSFLDAVHCKDKNVA